MLNHRRVWALLWMCAIAVAQPGAGQFASVSGVVANSVTGQPVLRAHVVLSPIGAATETYGAMTDAAGRFSILRIPPGSYNMNAERVGYIRGVSIAVKLQAG